VPRGDTATGARINPGASFIASRRPRRPRVNYRRARAGRAERITLHLGGLLISRGTILLCLPARDRSRGRFIRVEIRAASQFPFFCLLASSYITFRVIREGLSEETVFTRDRMNRG